MTVTPDPARPATRRERLRRERAAAIAKSDTPADTTTAAGPADGRVPSDSAIAGPDVDPDGGMETAFLHDVPEGSAEADLDRVPVRWADASRTPTALTWVDPLSVEAATLAQPLDEGPAPDVLADARRAPRGLRGGVLAPLGTLVAIAGVYASTTLLWPLDAVAPEVFSVQVEVAAAPPAVVTWPEEGSAAVSVEGFTTAASTASADEIASISKLASVLMVLDELPLGAGEQGPSFTFDRGDSNDYWAYRRSNQSALDVPVGGSLTEYQMLQGILLGSANNYVDRLSDEIWGSDRAFAEASRVWLRDHGIEGVTLESPSGFDERNVATPAGLIALGELAMKHPMIAEILATPSVELPGAGEVENTHPLLGEPGVLGGKTGTLSHWNLLTGKDVQVGDTVVRVFTAVLGQDGGDARVAVTRSLFADVEKSLAEQPVTVPAGTVVGRVSTEWGDDIDVVTDADARVVLWNGATATASAVFDLGDAVEAGDDVGTMTTSGPLNSVDTPVSLGSELAPPSAWWRLTHPLELFGIDRG